MRCQSLVESDASRSGTKTRQPSSSLSLSLSLSCPPARQHHRARRGLSSWEREEAVGGIRCYLPPQYAFSVGWKLETQPGDLSGLSSSIAALLPVLRSFTQFRAQRASSSLLAVKLQLQRLYPATSDACEPPFSHVSASVMMRSEKGLVYVLFVKLCVDQARFQEIKGRGTGRPSPPKGLEERGREVAAFLDNTVPEIA